MDNLKLISKQEPVKSEKKGKTTKDKIENTHTDELIIGICSPIGSLKTGVIDALTDKLENVYNYEVEVIKLSNFILEYFKDEVVVHQGKTDVYNELRHKIKGGDFLRKNYKNNSSILAELAIKKIREEREDPDSVGVRDISEMKSRRKCYIIDSLKNVSELKLLRTVYSDIFYMFSIFSLEEERKDFLLDIGLSKPEIDELMDTDEYEDMHHGQDVRNTFVESDFFFRVSKKNGHKTEDKISRALSLIFDSEIITPNHHETAMYNAKSAAGNSACLSRQVGATITDSTGVSIAKGWNDVPKFGGNLYDDSSLSLNRCKDLGYCSNVRHRTGIIEEIREEIRQELNNTGIELNGHSEQLLSNIISKIENSKFKNVIEYSRSIHAEMHAIVIGSQLTGSKMVDGSLYCTTYPCHNCARHIVLAGIKNIYYIEPYKKSLCLTLHDDSLTEDETKKDKVRILLFDGVAPRRYLEFFSMANDKRKDSKGDLIRKELTTIKPKKRISLQAIPVLETQAIIALVECGLINDD